MTNTDFKIYNHSIEMVNFGFWSGMAGVSRQNEFIEFSYIGSVPASSQIGEIGKIGEDRVELLSLSRSGSVSAMMVGRARIIE